MRFFLFKFYACRAVFLLEFFSHTFPRFQNILKIICQDFPRIYPNLPGFAITYHEFTTPMCLSSGNRTTIHQITDVQPNFLRINQISTGSAIFYWKIDQDTLLDLSYLKRSEPDRGEKSDWIPQETFWMFFLIDSCLKKWKFIIMKMKKKNEEFRSPEIIPS